MIAKLKILIENDFENKHQCNLLKPDCIDILIELLKNENTFNIEELSLVVLEALLKISETRYGNELKEESRGLQTAKRSVVVKLGSLKMTDN